MQNFKKYYLPFKDGINLSKDHCPETLDETESMKTVSYASVVTSIMYAMLCTRLNIYFIADMVSRYYLTVMRTLDCGKTCTQVSKKV